MPTTALLNSPSLDGMLTGRELTNTYENNGLIFVQEFYEWRVPWARGPSFLQIIPHAGLTNIMIPQDAAQRARLRANAVWHRTQAVIAKRKRNERDRLRHLSIAEQIEKVVRNAA